MAFPAEAEELFKAAEENAKWRYNSYKRLASQDYTKVNLIIQDLNKKFHLNPENIRMPFGIWNCVFRVWTFIDNLT